MEKLTHFQDKILPLAMTLMIIIGHVHGQSSTVCTGPMMRSFNSCLSFLSGGSNASSPTTACCRSLRDLTSNGQDCLCLIVTGGVPFQVPINRSLAISLPKACRQSGVPVECKATASPLPSPGPRNGAGGPSSNPSLSPPGSTVPFIPQPFTPPSPPQGGGGFQPPQSPQSDVIPTLTPPGMRPTLTSSALPSSHGALPSLLVTVMGAVLLM
ncbi:hypothetical protein ACS0TY_022755 [Phlomoides rotata]